jgi:PAS domain S-box-containing protein
VLRAIEWILLGAVSATSIIAGVRWHRPTRIGPWLLLAASVTALAVGDVFFALDDQMTAEACYLAFFVLVSLSLLQLTRGGALLVDRARLIDLLAFTCSALLVVWVFMIGDSGTIGNVSAADVIGDLVLIGVAGRLIAAAGRNWSAILLCTGAVGLLASNILYGLRPGMPAEIGYIVLYLAWGAAALHPSMSQLTTPVQVRPSPWRGRWAALLGLSVATPPLVLLIEAVGGTVKDGVVIAVVGGLTLILTITRLADSVAQSSQALSREKGLREASAALVAAADLPAVDEAVRCAIAQLMPPEAVRRIVFATDDRQLAAAALPQAEIQPHARSWWVPPAEAAPAESIPAQSAPPGPAPPGPAPPGPATPGSATPGPATPGPATPGSAPAAPATVRSLTAGEATLVCPLWLEPLAVARPSGGALALTGRRDVLTTTRDALEVLAGQAALALDRISLVEAMGRRDSDLYLRAVISNTADMMLVVDDDQRIRYASPALREFVGAAEIPALTTLSDLVHPDDRTMVRQALQGDGDGVVFCALRRPDESRVLVEATYRDLREDRLVQGFVVTMRMATVGHEPAEQLPQLDHLDEMPAWVNRRSARHKFRY